ncbi:unnamed protein product [Cuscuta epithymum]|uniref:Uncharacterized protein n=1 Tax=Cuscuta epithymum TaxID=186058 RepID=A0AAV0CM93_9ASTE|nr:unnamed protein product [Cuscuta epithymum]CAH9078403.1 unnamed protein product [Cuscuta epithymum]CAH9127274.1 unnamed protein product [Cuscuta epithymum]CAH9127275.1 unnamed protein product [Cuscuta epithymum]
MFMFPSRELQQLRTHLAGNRLPVDSKQFAEARAKVGKKRRFWTKTASFMTWMPISTLSPLNTTPFGTPSPHGDIMDPKVFAKLSNKLSKDKKKKAEGSPKQRAVEEFFPKPEAPRGQEGGGPLKDADAGVVAEGSRVPELKRKNAGKGTALPEKKQKRGDAEQKAPPVVIIDDPPSGKPSVSLPLTDFDEGAWPLEKVQFPIKKGTAIMHGTLDPREFLRGATPPLDRSTLGRFGDEALELKALQASATASLAFGELVRRAEQHRLEKAKSDEVTRKLVANNTEAIRQLTGLEEALRQAEQKLEAAKEEARALGKAEAERAAAEAAKIAAEEAEKAKATAVEEVEKKAVAAFTAGGWRAEDHEGWVASVVEARADAWVKGPGAMWLALKGKSFYEGAQYSTQAMLYRRLARHHGVDPKDFDPAAHGLPPLLPDVRVPLPEGEERELLEDSELAKCGDDDDDEEVGDGEGATSKAAEGGFGDVHA